MKKRLLSFFLALCLLLSCVVTAGAAEVEEQGSVTSEEASQTA